MANYSFYGGLIDTRKITSIKYILFTTLVIFSRITNVDHLSRPAIKVGYKSAICCFFISSIEVVEQWNQTTGRTFQAVLSPYLQKNRL